MRSPSIVFLMVVYIGMASATIYFKDGHVRDVQTQANLILHAFNNQNIELLYKLIPFGYDIDRYLKSHRVESVFVERAYEDGNKIKVIVRVRVFYKGHTKTYQAQLEMSPSRYSPTGYIMSKGTICETSCRFNQRKFGFF